DLSITRMRVRPSVRCRRRDRARHALDEEPRWRPPRVSRGTPAPGVIRGYGASMRPGPHQVLERITQWPSLETVLSQLGFADAKPQRHLAQSSTPAKSSPPAGLSARVHLTDSR